MKAAIYTRFSVDDDKSDSVAVQLSLCREFAAEKGFTVVTEHTDDGISGYSTGNRPGFAALMRAARAHEIDAVIFRDRERLARGPDLPVVSRELEFLQVLLLGMDGSDSRDQSWRLQVGLSAIMSSEMIERIRILVRLAARSRAKDGHHTGGRTVGYLSVPVPGTERKQLAIDEPRAAIVREIFQRYAEGESMRAIAEDLNARGVPSAGAHWKRESRRKDGKWLVSALHAILHNEIYIGRLVHGRRQFTKNPTTGKRVARDRPAAEWITREMPELAIIDRPMWDRVQARLGVNVGAGKTRAKPAYLLSGLLTCGECGSKMIVMGGKDRRYICGSYHGGGASACSNDLTVARLLAEELIVEPALKRLAAKVVDRTVSAVQAQTRAGRRAPVRRTSPALAKVNARIADLDRMVADGILSLTEAGPALERARAARVTADREANAAPVIDFAEMAEEFRGLAGRLRRALGGADVSQAREALRQMNGLIVLKPHTERGVARALKPEETLDGRGSPGGAWEDRYLVAHFSNAAEALPLHPFLTAEWLKATGISIGSGGPQANHIPAIPLRRKRA